jgi:hypothetical protein
MVNKASKVIKEGKASKACRVTKAKTETKDIEGIRAT